MNNQTTKNNLQQDPVLDVEEWKRITNQKIQGMNPEKLKEYYDKALDLVKPNSNSKNN